MLNMLRAVPVFESMDEAGLREFADLARPRDYQKGEFLCLQGDAWPYLILVQSGQIRAYKESVEGRSLLVTVFQPGELFWGLAFFEEGAPMPARLEAYEASRVWLWNRTRTQPLLCRHGELLWGMCRLMVQRMNYASSIIDGLAFQPVASRLARLLLEQYPAGQEPVGRNLTLDEMAARIGSTREMVCRILNRFAAQGAIQITRTEFVFQDREVLESLI